MKKLEDRVREYLEKPYARMFFPEEEGGYSAMILEFQGCFSEGDTIDEAHSNLEEAAGNWLRAAMEKDLPIPPPSSTQGYGGKVLLRLPKSLHKQAVRYAQKDGVSLNKFIVSAVASRIGAEDLCEKMTQRISHGVIHLISYLKTAETSMGQPTFYGNPPSIDPMKIDSAKNRDGSYKTCH